MLCDFKDLLQGTEPFKPVHGLLYQCSNDTFTSDILFRNYGRGSQMDLGLESKSSHVRCSPSSSRGVLDAPEQVPGESA